MVIFVKTKTITPTKAVCTLRVRTFIHLSIFSIQSGRRDKTTRRHSYGLLLPLRMLNIEYLQYKMLITRTNFLQSFGEKY